ncbi:unnamed protein product [Heterobilharzia americana]|nr:unnamed protein product [Heterobilharzia americana]
MGLKCLFAFEFVKQSMYQSIVLHCDCGGISSVLWTFNSSSINKKPGKHLIARNALRIFDLRRDDAGVYKCYSSSNKFKECVAVFLTVAEPRPYYKAVHEDSIPDYEGDEKERPYWHQKMKNTPASYEFFEKPLKLACYFYVMDKSINPVTEWLLPHDHDELNVHNSTEKPKMLDCNSIEETQRNLSGVCYVMEITIFSISGTDNFDCIVRTPNSTDMAISNSYIVLQKMTHLFASDLSDTDLAEFEAPNFELIEELRLPNGTNSSGVNAEDSYPDFLDFSFGDSSMNERQQVDLSTLLLSDYAEFRFYSLDHVACLSGEVNLFCEIPRALTQLEIWYFGQSGERPKFLKDSKVTEMLTNNEKRYTRFDNSIILKLTNLSLSDTGIITVVECSKSSFLYRFLPPIIIWMILFITLATIPLSLLFCLRAKRKSMRTIMSLPIDYKSKDAKPKRADFMQRINLLYTEPSQHQSPLLSPSSLPLSSPPSSSSSSSPSPSSLSPSSPFSSTTAVSTSTSNASKTACKWITESIELFSQKLLYQRKKYSSHEQNIILQSNILLLDWLRNYLHCNPKSCTSRSSFILENVIGEGTFGVVYKGRLCISDNESKSDTRSCKEIAVKTLKEGFQERQLVNLIRELRVLTSLKQHPYVIQCYGLCIDQGRPFILLEMAIYGNLRDFLRNLRPKGMNFLGNGHVGIDQVISSPSQYINLSELDAFKWLLSEDLIEQQIKELLTFALNIADALLYFESLHLVHRDVAARNVVITDGFIAKLCDFGYACTEDECNYGHMQMDKDYLPVRWMAPECLMGKDFTSKCDVWSYGILLWELFSLGNTPYPGINTDELIEWLDNGNRNSRPYLSTESIYQLMIDCWSHDTACRPAFFEIRNRISRIMLEYADLHLDESKKGYIQIILNEGYLVPRQSLH